MLSPRRPDPNAGNGPAIVVSAFVTMTIALLAVIVKIATKWSLARRLQIDDLLIGLSGLALVGYVVALDYQRAAGLGRTITVMSDTQILDYGRAEYTSSIFYVLSLGLAKWALLEFMRTLASPGARLWTTLGVLYFNILKTCAAILALVFQCSVPATYNTLGGSCIDFFAFWTAFNVLDMLITITTVGLPVYLLSKLQISRTRRWQVTLAFVAPITTLPAIVLRTVYLRRSFAGSDRPRDDYTAAILTTTHVVLCILTTCLPFLNPVLDGMRSGVLFNPDTAKIRSMSRSNQELSNLSRRHRKPTDIGSGIDKKITPAWSSFGNTTTNVEGDAGRGQAVRGDSLENLITKKTSISVEFEDAVVVTTTRPDSAHIS